MTGVGSSPALATFETSQVLSGGFPGVLPFRPTYRLARLDMSEIILKGTLNGIPLPLIHEELVVSTLRKNEHLIMVKCLRETCPGTVWLSN